jgi:hypothetical protein
VTGVGFRYDGSCLRAALTAFAMMNCSVRGAQDSIRRLFMKRRQAKPMMWVLNCTES